ncbi:AraC family transcriptional regulator [Metasolibacillus meyeri]|uniref:AraC family transcriptional regulator n=1 Tax=Metasolibacillus meyeri TaxID=1071052 RepID=UPI000D3239FE|nr:AraC family transcriptional regulator [Metasolibacillus meyeri]
MQHDADRFLMEHIFLKVLHMEHHESTLIDDTKQIKSNVWLVVEKGEISFTYAHKHYEISGFQIVHLTQHGQLTITSKHKASIYVIDYIGKVLYASSLLKILLEQAPMGQPLSFYPVAHTDVVLEIISNLYKHYKKQQKLAIQVSFHQLMAQVLLEVEQKETSTSTLEQALAYIERHVHEPIVIQEVVRHIQVPAHQLAALFKKHFGQAPKQYIRKRQQQLAETYLLQPHYRIKNVATALNFDNEFYFSNVFKKWTGVTPSQFVKNSINNMSEKYIGNENHFQYNENQLAQANRFEGRENEFMIQNMMHKIKLPLLLSLLLLLAACGNDTKKESSIPPKEEATTRVVVDDAGREVEIPAKPERIITDWHLGQILAVGVTPLMGTIYNPGFLAQHYTDEEILEFSDASTSFEKIIELKPDLIVTWNAEEVENYEKIAPTIVFDSATYTTPQEEILAMGQFLGREEEAQAFVEDFETRVAAAKEKIRKAVPEGSTFSLLLLSAKMAYAMEKEVDGGRALYDLLGMEPAPKIQELFDTATPERGRFSISIETLGDYVGDYVFATILVEDHNDLPTTWKNLEVVKNKKVIELDPKYYFASDPLSALYQAEEMVDKIEKLAKSKQ